MTDACSGSVASGQRCQAGGQRAYRKAPPGGGNPLPGLRRRRADPRGNGGPAHPRRSPVSPPWLPSRTAFPLAAPPSALASRPAGFPFRLACRSACPPSGLLPAPSRLSSCLPWLGRQRFPREGLPPLHCPGAGRVCAAFNSAMAAASAAVRSGMLGAFPGLLAEPSVSIRLVTSFAGLERLCAFFVMNDRSPEIGIWNFVNRAGSPGPPSRPVWSLERDNAQTRPRLSATPR
jgi:hypothetical protein